jgi:hypothetical protein
MNGEVQCGVQVFVIDNAIKISLIVTISELKGGESGRGKPSLLRKKLKMLKSGCHDIKTE